MQEEIAAGILQALGGAQNIVVATHCATRLRITLADGDRAAPEDVARVHGVLGVARSGDQIQVVVGPGAVAAVHADFQRRVAEGARPAPAPSHDAPVDASSPEPVRAGDLDSHRIHVSRPRRAARTILAPVHLLIDIITPLLPVFVAGGLLLALHNLISAPRIFGADAVITVLPWFSGPAALIGIIGTGVFALLPVLIGFSAASRFGASPYLGAAMGASLVAAPFIVDSGAFPALRLQGGGSWTLAGIDVLGVDYRGSVVPMIVVAAVLAAIERGLRKSLRGAASFLFVPMLTLLFTGALAFLVIGPAARLLGDAFATLISTVYHASGLLGGALIGALYPLLVVTGLHQSLVSLELGLIAGGGSFIFPVAGVANLAQAGACFAVALLARRGSRLRAIAGAAGVPASFGIAEPAVFGVNLRLQFPFVIAVASSAVGGALLATGDVEAVALGAAGVLGFASITPGLGVRYLACVVLTSAIAFAATCVWGVFRRPPLLVASDAFVPADPPGRGGTLGV